MTSGDTGQTLRERVELGHARHMKSGLMSFLVSFLTVLVVLVLLETFRRRGMGDPVARLSDVLSPPTPSASASSPTAPTPSAATAA